MTDWTDATAPTAEAIEQIARRGSRPRPPAFAPHAKDIVLRIEDFAGDEMLDELKSTIRLI